MAVKFLVSLLYHSENGSLREFIYILRATTTTMLRQNIAVINLSGCAAAAAYCSLDEFCVGLEYKNKQLRWRGC